ncbi:MAG: alkaline phosphatase family protein [Gemmataceae bacterium]
MKRDKSLFVGLALILTGCSAHESANRTRLETENVVVVMIDGLRWQEVFRGADEALLNRDRGGVRDVSAVNKKYWRTAQNARREALMPFTWNVIGKRGQLFGNRLKGSEARVTNGLSISYPGYSEALCGFADCRICSNNKSYNANVSVLEWLNRKPEFQGRIAAFASWEAFPFILNAKRSGLQVNAGCQPIQGLNDSRELRQVNQRIAQYHAATGNQTRPDELTYRAARLYLEERKPRALFVCFDEVDEEGHAGRYDRLLDSARRADAYVKKLWESLQAMPEYRNKTTLIVLPDHGRGHGPTDWKNHGPTAAGSEYVWMGFVGPDTPPLGERHNVEPLAEDQLAATVAALLGFDYRADVPKAGKAIAEVLRPDNVPEDTVIVSR